MFVFLYIDYHCFHHDLFHRHCDEVMFWINEKSAFLSTEEFGHDLEHVEVLQRKFDEFQKDMASQVCNSKNILRYILISYLNRNTA